MAFTFGQRLGNVQPFIRVHHREDDRYAGVQAGVTTYHETDSGSEEYRTTYLEWGGRSDHLSAPVLSMLDKDVTPLLTDTASVEDSDYIRRKSQPKAESASLQVVA